VTSAARQSLPMRHRTRDLMARQRTMPVNAIRAHMAEFGLVALVGLPQVGAEGNRPPPPNGAGRVTYG
jgi:transposase